MINLIKYDWLRRWKFFLAGILAFVGVNWDILNRINQGLGPRFITVILIFLLCILSTALIWDHMGRLYRTLFTNEGLTELTLPLNSYQLLGAKLLAIAMECIGVMVIVGMVFYFDLRYADQLIANFNMISLTGEILWELIQSAGFFLTGYLTFILMVYLSLTLAKSLFASFKHGRFIAFLCFLALGKILESASNLLNLYADIPGSDIITSTDWLAVLVLIGGLFAGTGYLLGRKVYL